MNEFAAGDSERPMRVKIPIERSMVGRTKGTARRPCIFASDSASRGNALTPTPAKTSAPQAATLGHSAGECCCAAVPR